MNMNATREGQLLEAAGVASILGGAAFLLRVVISYGVAAVDLSSLSLGLAASFMMLAGTTALVLGRALLATAARAGSIELGLWKLLAGVCMGAGAATIYFAYRQSLINPLPSLDELAVALSGSFMLMAGIQVLLAQRVMRYLGGKPGARLDDSTAEVSLPPAARK